jgi:hypothetical protein
MDASNGMPEVAQYTTGITIADLRSRRRPNIAPRELSHMIEKTDNATFTPPPQRPNFGRWFICEI